MENYDEEQNTKFVPQFVNFEEESQNPSDSVYFFCNCWPK